jgi:hypothetical protein
MLVRKGALNFVALVRSFRLRTFRSWSSLKLWARTRGRIAMYVRKRKARADLRIYNNGISYKPRNAVWE